MLVSEVSKVAPETMREGVGIRWLITEKEGAPNFAMRVIELEPGVDFMPNHHPYEHEIYVLDGEGVVTNPGGDVGEMKPGAFLFGFVRI